MTIATDNVRALQQQIKDELNLETLRISSAEALEQQLGRGLAALYKDVFAGPPYNEKFEIDEVKNIFHDFLDKKGIIFVALNPENKQPIAFVVSLPLRAEFELAKIAKDYISDVEAAGYFAEDGVAAEYRRRGLSTRMKKLLIQANSVEGVKEMLLRTSTKNYRQISSVNKAGGKVLKGQFQKIIRNEVDGGKAVDNNLFYSFETADTTPPQILDRVMVVRTNMGDKAFVFNKKASRVLTGKIKAAYPDVAAVAYVGNDNSLQKLEAGQIVFDGKMYLRSQKRRVGLPSPR